MPEWLIEQGIGETRYALFDKDDEILEARVLLDGAVAAGTLLEARLTTTGRNAIASAGGVEYLLPKGSRRATEGEAVLIEVTREALGGAEPWKRPLARIPDHGPGPAPLPEGRVVDQFPAGSWDDLQEEARSGRVPFPGGELRIAVTSAMTVMDVDGYLPAAELSSAAAAAVARAIRRHGIAGSIGIDFPGGTDKQTRSAAAAMIDSGLPGLFERTAINGFGFMQIIRPRRHASLFELALDRTNFEARALLRRVKREVPGAKCLVGHPSVITALQAKPDWLESLARELGGSVSLRTDPSLPISGGYAERA